MREWREKRSADLNRRDVGQNETQKEDGRAAKNHTHRESIRVVHPLWHPEIQIATNPMVDMLGGIYQPSTNSVSAPSSTTVGVGIKLSLCRTTLCVVNSNTNLYDFIPQSPITHNRCCCNRHLSSLKHNKKQRPVI